MLRKLVHNGKVRMVEVLLSKERFNLDAKDDEHGDTVLHVAAKQGNCMMVNLLLHHGANVRGFEGEGWGWLDTKSVTPRSVDDAYAWNERPCTSCATARCHTTTPQRCRAIIRTDVGAHDQVSTNMARQTPSDLAKQGGHEDCVNVLACAMQRQVPRRTDSISG